MSRDPMDTFTEHMERKRRLEAAAPELLEALKLMLDPDAHQPSNARQTLAKARAAILKAEGDRP